MWRLRSSYDENYAVCVYDEDPFNDAVIDPSVGVRPACNLDLSKVLFTSGPPQAENLPVPKAQER